MRRGNLHQKGGLMCQSYVYRTLKDDPGIFTVGFYDPNGEWFPESDYDSQDEAAKRVAWLNGGNI